MKSILAFPGIDRTVDVTSIYDFLTYLYVPTPKTILKKVLKLPPGYWLRWNAGEVLIRQYWDISFSNQCHITEEEAEEELKERLRECVSMRLISDVPVGVLLSGGLDSSIVAAYAKGETSGHLKTFSIGFKDSPKDETEYSRLMARALESDHIERVLKTDDARALKDTVIGLYDEPFADDSAIPTY